MYIVKNVAPRSWRQGSGAMNREKLYIIIPILINTKKIKTNAMFKKASFQLINNNPCNIFCQPLNTNQGQLKRCNFYNSKRHHLFLNRLSFFFLAFFL